MSSHHLQAKNLQELNNRGAFDAVIRQFESGSVVSTEASLGEYIKALARADRLDNSALLRVLQVPNCPGLLLKRQDWTFAVRIDMSEVLWFYSHVPLHSRSLATYHFVLSAISWLDTRQPGIPMAIRLIFFLT